MTANPISGRHVKLVKLVVGRTSGEVKWYKVVFDKVNIRSVELGMTSLCFRDKVGDDTRVVSDGWLTLAKGLGVSVLLSVLVELLHELHKLSIGDLVRDSGSSRIGLLLGVTSRNGERCG